MGDNTTPLYRVRNWDKHFETHRTRELKKIDWVPIPNSHDGDGYTELLDHPDGMAHYGAWLLILAVASKSTPRGVLIRDIENGDNPAHIPRTLARLTRGSAATFEEAIPRLVSIGWLETCDDPAQIPRNPAPLRGKPTIEGKGREGKGREGKEGKGTDDLGHFQSFVDLVRKCHPAFESPNITDMMILASLKVYPESTWEKAISEFKRQHAGAELTRAPLRCLEGYLRGLPPRKGSKPISEPSGSKNPDDYTGGQKHGNS